MSVQVSSILQMRRPSTEFVNTWAAATNSNIFIGPVGDFDFLDIVGRNNQINTAVASRFMTGINIYWYTFDPQGELIGPSFALTTPLNWGGHLVTGGGGVSSGSILARIPVLAPWCAITMVNAAVGGGAAPAGSTADLSINGVIGGSNFRIGQLGSSQGGGFGNPLLPQSLGEVITGAGGYSVPALSFVQFELLTQYVGEVQVNVTTLVAGFDIILYSANLLSNTPMEYQIRLSNAAAGNYTFTVYLRGFGHTWYLANTTAGAAKVWISMTPTGN